MKSLFNLVCVNFVNKIHYLMLIFFAFFFFVRAESSGKWPNELAAIERVKAAFYLQIGKMFRQTFHLQTKINVDSVDVIKGKDVNIEF